MTYQTSNNNQGWTVKQLIALSNSLAIAYSSETTPTQATKNQDQWTSEQFIKMSSSLAQAYCPGL